MGLDICKNHPGRKAVGHCVHCHMPLCEECGITSDNPKAKKKLFCSEEHRNAYETYIEAYGEKKLKKIGGPSILSRIIGFVVFLAVVYAAVWFLAPGYLPEAIRFGR